MRNPKLLLDVLGEIAVNFVVSPNRYTMRHVKSIKKIFSNVKMNCLNTDERVKFKIKLQAIEDDLKQGFIKVKNLNDDLVLKIEILEAVKEVIKSL